jgi:hypothetical protein
MSVIFVLLDVRMGGEGLFFMDDEIIGGVGLSFCGLAVPFVVFITSLAT